MKRDPLIPFPPLSSLCCEGGLDRPRDDTAWYCLKPRVFWVECRYASGVWEMEGGTPGFRVPFVIAVTRGVADHPKPLAGSSHRGLEPTPPLSAHVTLHP